jgi:hypothetical protein
MVDIQQEPRQLLVGAALMLGTTVIQTSAVVLLQELVLKVRESVSQRATQFRMQAVLCSVMVYLFALHLLEMTLWAAFYLVVGDFRTFSEALYQSALAFTTMNIAHLPADWKFLSAAEGVTGLLMFAWSTGVMFNQTSWVTEARRQFLHKHHLCGLKDGGTPSS